MLTATIPLHKTLGRRPRERFCFTYAYKDAYFAWKINDYQTQRLFEKRERLWQYIYSTHSASTTPCRVTRLWALAAQHMAASEPPDSAFASYFHTSSLLSLGRISIQDLLQKHFLFRVMECFRCIQNTFYMKRCMACTGSSVPASQSKISCKNQAGDWCGADKALPAQYIHYTIFIMISDAMIIWFVLLSQIIKEFIK